jgi:hypothetical protein
MEEHAMTRHHASRAVALRILAIAIVLGVITPCIANGQPGADLSAEQVRDIVRRSYQYVAICNVMYKARKAIDARGWNELGGRTTLTDHTRKVVARPNNDTLLLSVGTYLRDDALVVEYPALDSDYASLEVCCLGHYCEVFLSTARGDFAKPTRVLFYSDRTRGYTGEKVPGIDRIVKMNSDYGIALVRVMPHMSDRPRYERIVKQIQSAKVQTLSEFLGKPKQPIDAVKFPAGGTTDADVFGTNLLEVMQFVFNHTTFDPKDPLDRGVLAIYKPLGVEPGKKYDPAKVAKIDHARFRRAAEQVAVEELAKSGGGGGQLFRPKGKMQLDALVHQSVVGPIGLPSEEATYFSIPTADGQPMKAKHDYVLRMSKADLPPARAFWSFTLYETKTGFFIPNDQKKYSVGHNAGMKLNKDGGIDIHIAAKKPEGVPAENWLPINRGDQQVDVIVRMYVPDLEKLKTWRAPKAERLPAP